MKAFVRQQVSLQVRTATPLTKEKLQKIIPVKGEDGIIVGYKECVALPSPAPSPKANRSNKLYKQTPLDMYEDDDGSDSIDDDAPSPPSTPTIERKTRSSLPEEQLFRVTITEKRLQAIERKRSRSEVSPILVARVVSQLNAHPGSQSMSSSRAGSEDEENQADSAFDSVESTSKARRSSSRKNKKSKSLMRKRTKSNTEAEVENVSTAATIAVASNRFKRKTSLFRGKSKDNYQRAQSIPNELTMDGLGIPDNLSLERKPSFKNSLKEAINSTLKSPRLNRRTGDDIFNYKGKSFDAESYSYGFKLEVGSPTDNPEVIH